MKIDDKNLKKIKISPITSIIPEEEIEKAERLSQKTSYGGSLSKRLKDSFIVYASAQINGENVLDDSIFALTMHQKAASHCSFEMLCSADDFEGRKDYPLKNSRKLLGSRITFHLWQFSKITSSFTGVISQIRSQRTDGYSEVVISGYSPTILLEDGKECRSWEDRTLAEIVTEVTKEYPQDTVQTTINPNLKDRLPYTVQYRESDWEFLKRLAARYGEWLYYDGQYIAFGGGYSKTLELIEKEDIYDYNLDMKLVPQKFDYLAYDAKLGKVHEADSERVDIARRVINPFQIDALEASETAYPKKPTSLYNRNLLEGGLGELTNIVRRQKQSRRNVMYMYAKTNNPNIRLGDCVKMYGWVAGNTMFSTPKVPIETYMVTEIIHHMNIAKDGYWNEIWGVPEDVEVPDYFDEDAVPQCEEQSAVVTDNNDPRGMGRVRVQFAWQKNSNRKSPWIRLVQPHGGAGKGFHFLPEIGEEVMVSFEGGNAEKPFVLGSHYNGNEKSGYTTEGNDLKVIHTRSGTKIILNDAEGSVHIEDPSGNIYEMDGKGNVILNAPKDMDMTAGENVELNAGNNLTFDAGSQTFMDSGEQMRVTSPYMEQIISDYYHTQAGRALINSQDEIKIEGRQTSVAGTESLLMHSDQEALVNSQGVVEVKGKQGDSRTNDAVKYETVKDEVAADCIVQFRPYKDWSGEDFGFDWMRMGDTIKQGDTKPYKDIMGKYKDANGKLVQLYSGGIFEKYTDDIEYKKLQNKYDLMTIDGTDDPYIVPYLSLYEGKSAKFSLKMNIKKSPQKLIFKYDTNLFQLKPEEIANKSEGERDLPDYLTVTCIKEFDTDQYINVLADDKPAGRIKVIANGKAQRKKLSVVLAPVKTDVSGNGNTKTGIIKGEKDNLKKYLAQALITPNVVTIADPLDLTGDPKFKMNKGFINANGVIKVDSSLHNYMRTNYDLRAAYPNHFIIYVFGLKGTVPVIGLLGGQAYGINSDSAAIFSSGGSEVFTHELMHCMGLYHTFDNKGDFTFEQYKTNNLMDYSYIRYITWKWQWDIIRGNSLVTNE